MLAALRDSGGRCVAWKNSPASIPGQRKNQASARRRVMSRVRFLARTKVSHLKARKSAPAISHMKAQGTSRRAVQTATSGGAKAASVPSFGRTLERRQYRCKHDGPRPNDRRAKARAAQSRTRQARRAGASTRAGARERRALRRLGIVAISSEYVHFLERRCGIEPESLLHPGCLQRKEMKSAAPEQGGEAVRVRKAKPATRIVKNPSAEASDLGRGRGSAKG